MIFCRLQYCITPPSVLLIVNSRSWGDTCVSCLKSLRRTVIIEAKNKENLKMFWWHYGQMLWKRKWVTTLLFCCCLLLRRADTCRCVLCPSTCTIQKTMLGALIKARLELIAKATGQSTRKGRTLLSNETILKRTLIQNHMENTFKTVWFQMVPTLTRRQILKFSWWYGVKVHFEFMYLPFCKLFFPESSVLHLTGTYLRRRAEVHQCGT